MTVKLVMEGNGLLMENVRESLKNMVVEVVFGCLKVQATVMSVSRVTRSHSRQGSMLFC